MTTLFDRADSPADRARVRGCIASHIVAFLRDIGVGNTFHVSELHRYVAAREPVAPASADRILRDLRSRGEVQYRVINRSKSLYEVRA